MATELMETLSAATSPDNFESSGSQPLPLAESAALRTGLTLDDIAHPAYMLNCNFELNWYNEAAREQVLGFDVVPPGTESRNIFHILGATDRRAASARDELIRLYVALSKSRVSRTALVMMAAKLGEDAIQLINDCYDKSGDGTRKMVVDFPCRIDGSDGKAAAWRVYGIYFREGILIIHVPDGETDPNVLEFISRRNIVVHNLMRKQMPAYTAQNYRASRLAEPGSADALRAIKVLGSKLMAQERARANPAFLKSD